jgi:hypothetical protein
MVVVTDLWVEALVGVKEAVMVALPAPTTLAFCELAPSREITAEDDEE